MESLQGTIRHNEEAVIREFEAAVADGNMALAERIAAANPDIFPADYRERPAYGVK